MSSKHAVVTEFSALMDAQLAGELLTDDEARRLSELLSSDADLVRLAVEMAIANEACEALLAKLAL